MGRGSKLRLMDEWVTMAVLEELGVSSATLYRKTRSGEWKYKLGPKQGRTGQRRKMLLLSTLPDDIQMAYYRKFEEKREGETPDVADQELSRIDPPSDRLQSLQVSLSRFPLAERERWQAEILRLAQLVERYDSINPKRTKNPSSNKPDFVPEIYALCKEAACEDDVITSREPSRKQPPSPHTLDRWSRRYANDGLLAFLKTTEKASRDDHRKAEISDAAVNWINEKWRNFRSPRALFKAAQKRAKQEGWIIPSESWFYRQWEALPKIVKTTHLQGRKAYISKHAPYVPRDASDLAALQILCGDHSQRDVTVMLWDGTLVRPWLTVWQCLRTGLIWGLHLDLTPSSWTAGMAYAKGVRQFGAQPVSRPDDDFYSYVYTDQGKDYKSRNWDGHIIEVHKHAMKFEGGIEVLRVQRDIGFLAEMNIKHLIARGYNAREKPVERLFRDISDWEENTFDEFCGRDAKNRPDLWRKMYADHLAFQRGKRSESPMIGFEEYLDALIGRLHEYNTSEHQRSTLNDTRIVPLEEFQRLYTTHYKISEEALALLLMKAEKRVIRKNGVGCSAAHSSWHYLHPAMGKFKGSEVEVRYDPNDLSCVWVFLPDGQICEAELVERSSYLKANKKSVALLKETEAYERKVIREYNYITFARLRGETIEERVAAQLEEEIAETALAVGDEQRAQGHVQTLTRMDAPKLRAVRPAPVTIEQVAAVEPDDSIFETPDRGQVRLWDFEDTEE